MNKALFLAALAVLVPLASADQGGLVNSGGSTSAGSSVYVTSTVASPGGTLTINGGALSFVSNDGTLSINATFTSSSNTESCAGGGKGGHVTCGYTFTGSFSGTATINGTAQAIVGSTSQVFGTGGAAATGATIYNSAYSPFYYSDSEQIHRADDLQGTNQVSLGGFYGAYGIALDAAGKIYVADTYNCRIVRVDDMNGTNWTQYGGTCGSGQGQFYDPSGIALDGAGRIYVLDTGNSRVVRIDDLTGANWIAYGSNGNGAGQFASYITSLSVDSSSRIYVADTGNLRVVRMDDMSGTNWTVLTSSPVVNGASYSLQSPAAVAVDSTGRIYIADNEYYQPAVVRVDDMTGANWTYVYTGSGGGLNSVSVDAAGSVFAGGGGAHIVDGMLRVLNSSGAIGPIGSYYVFGVTPVPLPSPRPSAISFTPAAVSLSQNVGTSGSQAVTVANFGGSPLNVSAIAASGGFTQTNNCIGQLSAGSSCTVTVSFAPSVTGPVNGSLTIADDSGNLGPGQTVALSGVGTAPVASLSPASLSFSGTVLGTTSSPRNVVLSNVGTGPMQVSSLVAAGPFSETNTCSASIAPGGSCTISVSFTPVAVGSVSGTISIADDAGTQTVPVTGNGSAPVSFSSTSLSFGTLAVGETSAAKSVTLTNRASAALTFASIVASTGFTIASNTCGTGIAAGASCTVGVTFTPAALGSVAGTLTFTDSALTSPQTVTLSGTGGAPVTLSSSSLGFNTTVVGSTSSAKTVTLTSHENIAINIASITVTAGFSIASNSCGTSLAAGASCTVGVTFSPTAVGSATGTLTFSDDPGIQTVTLSGTGSAPVTFSSSALNFGTVTVGATSSPKTVTVTNRSAGAVTFLSIVASAGFAVASNTCGAGIGAGASCTVGVTFSPTASGAVTGTLTFTDSAATSPQTVGLSGTGR